MFIKKFLYLDKKMNIKKNMTNIKSKYTNKYNKKLNSIALSSLLIGGFINTPISSDREQCLLR
jgi:hypothetical protein